MHPVAVDPAEPVLAELVRSGLVESRHHGSVAVTCPDGRLDWSVGVADQPMYPRSANKPMQALGMLRAGLRLHGELLALAGGSHAGERFHVEGVRTVLASVGLDETALRNPRAYPYDAKARKRWVRAGQRRARVTMNCSGKHAAMLATCVANAWPTETYLDPTHPLQQTIHTTLEELSDEPVASVAIDGCGAPLHAISLTGLARAFGRFASAPPQTLPGRVAAAFTAHPEYVSGSRRLSATLTHATPGLFLKAGAEGVIAAGLPDGRGIAIKINDGASRARHVVLAGILHHLGVRNEFIDSLRQRPILGGDQPVGFIRATDLPRDRPAPPA